MLQVWVRTNWELGEGLEPGRGTLSLPKAIGIFIPYLQLTQFTYLFIYFYNLPI